MSDARAEYRRAYNELYPSVRRQRVYWRRQRKLRNMPQPKPLISRMFRKRMKKNGTDTI